MTIAVLSVVGTQGQLQPAIDNRKSRPERQPSSLKGTAMLKTLALTLAIATLATPALAETFTHEGVTYEYTVEQKGNIRVITGKDTSSGRPFELTVRSGWVDGHVDGTPVSFSKREVVRLRPTVVSAEIAAR
jgi:hypothetical protein